MKRVIALLMENQPGALSRVVGLFSQRGYNIETLVVAPTTDPTLSRLTMSTKGDEKVVEQITKQLDKLIDVVVVSKNCCSSPYFIEIPSHAYTKMFQNFKVCTYRDRMFHSILCIFKHVFFQK